MFKRCFHKLYHPSHSCRQFKKFQTFKWEQLSKVDLYFWSSPSVPRCPRRSSRSQRTRCRRGPRNHCPCLSWHLSWRFQTNNSSLCPAPRVWRCREKQQIVNNHTGEYNHLLRGEKKTVNRLMLLLTLPMLLFYLSQWLDVNHLTLRKFDLTPPEMVFANLMIQETLKYSVWFTIFARICTEENFLSHKFT